MADKPNEYVARLGLELLTLWLVPGEAARIEASEHIDAAVRKDGRLDADVALDAMLGIFRIEELLVDVLGEALGLSPVTDDRIALDNTRWLDELLLRDPHSGEVDPMLYNDIMGHGLNLCTRVVLLLTELAGVDVETVLEGIAPKVHQLDE